MALSLAARTLAIVLAEYRHDPIPAVRDAMRAIAERMTTDMRRTHPASWERDAFMALAFPPPGVAVAPAAPGAPFRVGQRVNLLRTLMATGGVNLHGPQTLAAFERSDWYAHYWRVAFVAAPHDMDSGVNVWSWSDADLPAYLAPIVEAAPAQ